MPPLLCCQVVFICISLLVCPFIGGSTFLDIRNHIFPFHVHIYYSSAQYYCANKQMNEGQRGSSKNERTNLNLRQVLTAICCLWDRHRMDGSEVVQVTARNDIEEPFQQRAWAMFYPASSQPQNLHRTSHKLNPRKRRGDSKGRSAEDRS